MKKVLTVLAIVSLSLSAACASKSSTETSAEAKKQLDDKWSPKVGTATKSEFVEEFGNASWCRPKESGDGEETCRFLRNKGTKWLGEKTDRKSVTQHDEIVAEFDHNGVLRSYKSTAQR